MRNIFGITMALLVLVAGLERGWRGVGIALILIVVILAVAAYVLHRTSGDFPEIEINGHPFKRDLDQGRIDAFAEAIAQIPNFAAGEVFLGVESYRHIMGPHATMSGNVHDGSPRAGNGFAIDYDTRKVACLFHLNDNPLHILNGEVDRPDDYEPRVFDFRDVLGIAVVEDGLVVERWLRRGADGKSSISFLKTDEYFRTLVDVPVKKRAKRIVGRVELSLLLNNHMEPVFSLCFLAAPLDSQAPLFNTLIKDPVDEWVLRIRSVITDADAMRDSLVAPSTGRTNGAGGSHVDELVRLSNLVDAGLLTYEEFDIQKAKVLAAFGG